MSFMVSGPERTDSGPEVSFIRYHSVLDTHTNFQQIQGDVHLIVDVSTKLSGSHHLHRLV